MKATLQFGVVYNVDDVDGWEGAALGFVSLLLQVCGRCVLVVVVCSDVGSSGFCQVSFVQC